MAQDKGNTGVLDLSRPSLRGLPGEILGKLDGISHEILVESIRFSTWYVSDRRTIYAR